MECNTPTMYPSCHFVINRWDEGLEDVVKLVNDIHRVYPASNVSILYDGSSSLRIPGVENIECSKLKSPSNGGAWTDRYLSYFLTHCTEDYLIKLDPDSTVIKEMKDFPTEDCIFCRLSSRKVPHGGALGFTRGVVDRIVKGGWMLNPRFINNFRYNNYNDLMMRDVLASPQYRNMEEELKYVHRSDFSCGDVVHRDSTFSHP